MDFSLSENQEVIKDLVHQLISDHAAPQRLKEVESSEDAFDRDLWKALAASQVLGLWVSPEFGGEGLGVLELCIALEVQGAHVAQVPLGPVAAAAIVIDRHGSTGQRAAHLADIIAGERFVVPAIAEVGQPHPTIPATRAREAGGRFLLTGHKVSVPGGHVASHYVVLARVDDGTNRCFIVDRDASGLHLQRARTTNRELQAHLVLEDVEGSLVGDERAAKALYETAVITMCALQVGVIDAALHQTAAYASTRHQFGKPLSYFQAVLMRAADAYIDVDALRLTTRYAAWQLAQDIPAAAAVAIAKWWASEAGHRVAHAAMHLHGGLGNDLDYPLHRYYLWAKQIDASLGSAPQQLAFLGARLAAS